MEYISKGKITLISTDDVKQFRKLSKYFSSIRLVDPLGAYKSMSDDQVWLHAIQQLAVMGGSRQLDKLVSNTSDYLEFSAMLSLRQLESISPKRKLKYLQSVFGRFKPARFNGRLAEKVNAMLTNPQIVSGSRLVLLKGLSFTRNVYRTRNALMERNPLFRLKSASDFMITLGLSHDVIALDSRVVGVLNQFFNFNMTVGRIQGNESVYLSVEDSLRTACNKAGITLGQLDRILFRYSNKSALAFVLEDK